MYIYNHIYNYIYIIYIIIYILRNPFEGMETYVGGYHWFDFGRCLFLDGFHDTFIYQN